MRRFARTLILPGILLCASPVEDLLAVIGAPATPLSYAGTTRRVARRTARRTSARVATATAPAQPVVVTPAPVVVTQAPAATAAIGTTVASLPDGAKTLTVDGKTYYTSGGVYYQPFYNGPSVVYMIVASPL
jgi:hypothetical protein